MKTVESSLLDEMVRRLVARFHPEKVILFGSQVWGQADEDSDLDLMVIVSGSDAPPAERARQAYRCLRGINVPTDVLVRTRKEIDRFSSVHASLESEILERGRVLYG